MEDRHESAGAITEVQRENVAKREPDLAAWRIGVDIWSDKALDALSWLAAWQEAGGRDDVVAELDSIYSVIERIKDQALAESDQGEVQEHLVHLAQDHLRRVAEGQRSRRSVRRLSKRRRRYRGYYPSAESVRKRTKNATAPAPRSRLVLAAKAEVVRVPGPLLADEDVDPRVAEVGAQHVAAMTGTRHPGRDDGNGRAVIADAPGNVLAVDPAHESVVDVAGAIETFSELGLARALMGEAGLLLHRPVVAPGGALELLAGAQLAETATSPLGVDQAKRRILGLGRRDCPWK